MKVLQMIATAATLSQTTAVSVNDLMFAGSPVDPTYARLHSILFPYSDDFILTEDIAYCIFHQVPTPPCLNIVDELSDRLEA